MTRYRFHGRFISESDARRLLNLRGASQYVTLNKSKVRSEAARRGWETRREQQKYQERLARIRERVRLKQLEALRRSEAAQRGWETRRKRERIPPEIEEEAEELEEIPALAEYYPELYEEAEEVEEYPEFEGFEFNAADLYDWEEFALYDPWVSDLDDDTPYMEV